VLDPAMIVLSRSKKAATRSPPAGESPSVLPPDGPVVPVCACSAAESASGLGVWVPPDVLVGALVRVLGGVVNGVAAVVLAGVPTPALAGVPAPALAAVPTAVATGVPAAAGAAVAALSRPVSLGGPAGTGGMGCKVVSGLGGGVRPYTSASIERSRLRRSSRRPDTDLYLRTRFRASWPGWRYST
jgi:hypothetical protein